MINSQQPSESKEKVRDCLSPILATQKPLPLISCRFPGISTLPFRWPQSTSPGRTAAGNNRGRRQFCWNITRYHLTIASVWNHQIIRLSAIRGWWSGTTLFAAAVMNLSIGSYHSRHKNDWRWLSGKCLSNNVRILIQSGEKGSLFLYRLSRSHFQDFVAAKLLSFQKLPGGISHFNKALP